MKQQRQILILLCAIVALTGAIVAFFALFETRNFMLRGYADPTQTSELPYRLPRFGVNVDLTRYDEQELLLHLGLMRQAHTAWIRQFAYWDQIETVEGVYDWSLWDNLIASLQDFPELELVVVISNSPSWAKKATTESTAPPDSPDTFARFVRAFADRYGETVDYYQIWDEPNIQLGWGGAEPRAADYAALLQEAYQAIHSVDSSAYVLAAALAPTAEAGPHNFNELQFLRDLYSYGVKDFSDAIAAKPYGFNFSPEDRIVDVNRLNFSRIIALREIMVEYGDARKSLWAAHWGWNSLPDDWSGAPSVWGSVSESDLISYTLTALDRAEREWPWLGGMILHQWQPNAALDNPQWGFSLIAPDNSPKALWTALVNRGIQTSATNGLYPAQNPYAQYSGIWTFSSFGADLGWVDDSQAGFDFYGQDIALLLRQDNYVAHLYPRLSDGSANDLPTDVNGNPFVLLTSETLKPEISLVSVARNLPLRVNRLQITADELVPDELVNRWPLLGYAVSSGNLAEPYDRQIIIAGITTVIALAAVIVSAWQISWYPFRALFVKLWNPLGSAAHIVLSGITSLAVLLGMYLTWGDGLPSLFRRDSIQIALSVVTSGLIYINEPGIVLTIAAAMALFVISYNRLELGLMLVVFWSPFFLFPVELYQFAFPLAEIILLITLFAWILRSIPGLKTRKYHLRSRLLFIDYLVLLWVVLGCVSLIWSDHHAVAFTELRTLIIQPALFYLIYRTLPPDKRTVLLLTDALIAAGTVVAVAGLIMWLGNDGVITAEAGVRRLASVYGSPNNVGLLLGRCLPFLLAFILMPKDRLRQRAAVVSGIIVITAAVLTQSAGALFLGIPAGVSIVVLLKWRRRALIPLIVLTVIFVIGIVLAVQSPRFSRFVDLTDGTNFYRLRVWQSSINMLDDHPFTGLGLDQFLYKFRGRYIMPDAWEEPELSHPHNIILDFWLRFGIPGVMLFLSIELYFCKTARRLYRTFRLNNAALASTLVIGLMGSMGSLLAHGLVDNSIFVLDLAYIFMFLLGSLAVLQNIGAIDAQH